MGIKEEEEEYEGERKSRWVPLFFLVGSGVSVSWAGGDPLIGLSRIRERHKMKMRGIKLTFWVLWFRRGDSVVSVSGQRFS